jgi:protocatechuate 3,4-dioxygenase beta subunit
MNGRRKTLVLLGAAAIAVSTALFVLTLERPSASSPPIATTTRSTTHSGEHPSPSPDGEQAASRAVPEDNAPPPNPPIGPGQRAVRGEVHDTSGRPIARAEVRLALVEPAEEHDLGSSACDASGHFTMALALLDEIPTARRALAEIAGVASAPGYQSQKQKVRLRATSGAEEPLAFSFRLTAGNVLRGRVVDRSGRAVPSAEIELLVRGADEGTGPHAARRACSKDRTASDGSFALGFVSSGVYQLAAREPNTGTAFQEKLDLAAGSDRQLDDVVLHGDGMLGGRARYPDGSPARALELWAIPDWSANEPDAAAHVASQAPSLERDDGLVYGRTTTDASGKFHFAGLKPGNYAIRSPRPEMVLEPHQARFILGSEDVKIEVQTSRLLVHVKDESGRALPGASVGCAEMKPAEDGRLEPRKIDHAQASGPDATAAFEIDAERTYALTATSPGSLPAEDLVITAPGEFEIARDLSLRAAGAKGRLHVTLDGAANESVSRLEIAFSSALTGQRDESIGVVSPDADGWLSLPPGRYRLEVGFGAREGELSMYFPIQSRAEVEIRSGQSFEHVVRARLGARVRLSLDAPDAPPAPTPTSAKQRESDLRAHGAAVTIACGAESEKRAVQFLQPAPELSQRVQLASLLAPGSSALIADLLEPGECTLHVEAREYQSVDVRVRLAPGAVEDVHVALIRK